jgi:hypothetical protein
MYNRPNGQTSMAAVQGPNRHLGTQDRPRQTDKNTKLYSKFYIRSIKKIPFRYSIHNILI